MEDAVTVGVPQSVVLASLAVLKFVDRRLSAIVAVMVIAWTVACSEYLIAIPVIGIMGLCALAWLYELLVKLEKRWDPGTSETIPQAARSTSMAERRCVLFRTSATKRSDVPVVVLFAKSDIKVRQRAGGVRKRRC